MAKTVIKIENLSKIYRLGEVGTGTLSHDLERWWRMNVLGQEDPYAKVGTINDRTQKSVKGEHVAALRDINLEVKEGEVLGIIGKNGAGKSTLLKILSRVTSPTTGTVKVKGRMASLLEVGTGFHPEMTGRENIYMNGTIMGMRKWEIDKKLDEIVEFAGVAKYLDTPVKRYSSGMTVRLGFAIAAYLEPEILIVDEVLAVGDAEFQKKAVGKMQDVSHEHGRTVLFVSHNLEAVKALCIEGILLNNGLLEAYGKVNLIIDRYLIKNHYESKEYYFINDFNKQVFVESAFLKLNGIKGNKYSNNNTFEIIIVIRANRDVSFSVEVLIKDQNKTPILFSPIGLIYGHKFCLENNTSQTLILTLNPPFLASGKYYIDLMVVESGIKYYDYVENALYFSVDTNYIQKTSWNFKQQRGQGSILLNSIDIKYE